MLVSGVSGEGVTELLRAACISYFVDDREPLTEYV